jgi:hypothetical protein
MSARSRCAKPKALGQREEVARRVEDPLLVSNLSAGPISASVRKRRIVLKNSRLIRYATVCRLAEINRRIISIA